MTVIFEIYNCSNDVTFVRHIFNGKHDELMEQTSKGRNLCFVFYFCFEPLQK